MSRWDARRVLLANATLQLLLVVVIVALANTLAQAWFLRVDLSADRLHSLDDATRALFDQFAWLLGPSGAGPQIHYGILWTVAIALAITLLALLPVGLARTRRDVVGDDLRRTSGPRS